MYEWLFSFPFYAVCQINVIIILRFSCFIHSYFRSGEKNWRRFNITISQQCTNNECDKEYTIKWALYRWHNGNDQRHFLPFNSDDVQRVFAKDILNRAKFFLCSEPIFFRNPIQAWACLLWNFPADVRFCWFFIHSEYRHTHTHNDMYSFSPYVKRAKIKALDWTKKANQSNIKLLIMRLFFALYSVQPETNGKVMLLVLLNPSINL